MAIIRDRWRLNLLKNVSFYWNPWRMEANILFKNLSFCWNLWRMETKFVVNFLLESAWRFSPSLSETNTTQQFEWEKGFICWYRPRRTRKTGSFFFPETCSPNQVRGLKSSLEFKEVWQRHKDTDSELTIQSSSPLPNCWAWHAVQYVDSWGSSEMSSWAMFWHSGWNQILHPVHSK